MSVKIKICGLKRLEDVAAVNAVLPDYVGFVFAGQKRRVTPETARALKAALDPRIAAVGVFIDEPVDRICALVEAGTIDLVQLHGAESDETVRRLQARTGVPVIKALTPDAFDRAQDCPADFLLLDSGCGSGRTFDWSRLPSIRRPYFLAGGIGLDNLAAAKALCPYGVDVSSGAETDGLKDAQKIKKIVEIIRKK